MWWLCSLSLSGLWHRDSSKLIWTSTEFWTFANICSVHSKQKAIYKWVTTSQLFKGHTNYHLAKLQPKSKQQLKQLLYAQTCQLFVPPYRKIWTVKSTIWERDSSWLFCQGHNLLATIKHHKARHPNNARQVESRNERVQWFSCFSRCQLVSSLVLWFTRACPVSDLRSRLPAVNTCGKEESTGGPKTRKNWMEKNRRAENHDLITSSSVNSLCSTRSNNIAKLFKLVLCPTAMKSHQSHVT